jgi:hypothetical protein
MPELGEPVHPILEQLEPLQRCEAEGPLDQGKVNPVGRLLRPRAIWQRFGGSGKTLGHGTTIARGVTT